MSLPKYPKYQESGVEWLGEVPTHWGVRPIWSMYHRTKRTGFPEEELLSVYRDHGVIPKSSRTDNFNKPSDDLSSYQLVSCRDLVINKMKAWQGSVAISNYRGIVSPAYFVYSPNNSENSRFLHYLFRSGEYTEGYLSISKGVRPNQWDLDPDAYRRFPVLVPPLPEQCAIAAFLDRECNKIDALIAEQERLIALLEEKRQAVISHAVTKGLDPNAPMKDSGISWIGMVPKEWRISKVKHMGTLKGGAGFPQEFQGDETKDVPFFKVGDLGRSSDGRSMPQAQHTIDCETASILRANIFSEDTIVYAKIGAALLLNRRRISVGSCCIDNNMTGFSVGDGIDVRWAYEWLSWIDFSMFVNPGAVPSLSEGDQGEIPCLLPPITEQIRVSDMLATLSEKHGHETALAEKNIRLLGERRAALISAAVTGKIDVRGLVDLWDAA